MFKCENCCSAFLGIVDTSGSSGWWIVGLVGMIVMVCLFFLFFLVRRAIEE